MLPWMHFREWDAAFYAFALMAGTSSRPDATLPYGDGKPVLILPRRDLGAGWVRPLRQFLGHLGYRATILGGTLDPPFRARALNALHRATARSERKAVFVGHGDGAEAAIAIAADRPHQVQSIVALGAPGIGSVTEAGVAALRARSAPTPLHLILSRREWAAEAPSPDALALADGPPMMLTAHPAALRALAHILADLGIELLRDPDPGASDDET